MPSPDFMAVIEAVRQLSTEVMFALLIRSLEKSIESVIFSLDLVVILLTIMMQRILVKHQTIRPMGLKLGYGKYYSNRQLRHLERVFLRGLALERGHDPDAGLPPPL